MEQQQWHPQQHWQPAPPPQESYGVGTTVMVAVVLFATLINLGLTVYVFIVARGLVEAGEQIQSYFGG